jgi:hypothetical protein
MTDYRYAREYIHIHTPNEAIPAIFKNEFERYRRGFAMGMFGSARIKTGGGKSLTCLTMASESDRDFNINQVAFTPGYMLQLLANFEKTNRRGGIVIFEEAQNFASNRTWYSLYNKTIMHTIATFRNLRCAAIFISPMARMVDPDVIKMMRFHATARLSAGPGGSLEGFASISEVYTYNNDKDIGRLPLNFYCPETGQVIIGDEYKVYLPDPALVEAYEEKVDEYKREFRGDLQAEAEQFAEAEKSLMRRPMVFKPKELASKMLEDKAVISELTNRGSVSSGAISAFFPNLRKATDQSAVKWWVEQSWKELNKVSGK